VNTDDMVAKMYGELCDLFDQAIFMGRNKTFDDQPETGADRMMTTSPQARRFATAAMEALGLE
jgi:hypothetical protein